jgi:hypothetical protein
MKRRFVLAWELGAGLGHVSPQGLIAKELLSLGHEVHLVWRDLTLAQWVIPELLDHPDVRLWQAPLWSRQLRGVPEPANYAELLFHAGWLDAAALAPLVRAWIVLLQTVMPDMVLLDHAPTALLSARHCAVRTACMGTGFFLPPTLVLAHAQASTPSLPHFRPWESIAPTRLVASEKKALEVANQALSRVSPGAAPILDWSGLLAADADFLLTSALLDHYGDQRGQLPHSPAYWGALRSLDLGGMPHWPQDETSPKLPKIFVYLKSDFPGLACALKILGHGPWQALVCVLGLSANLQAQYSTSRMRIVGQLVHIATALQQAQAVVCAAGHGLLSQALGAGVPVVMLPMLVEQRVVALRVEAAGCAVLVPPPQLASQLAPALHRALHDSAMRDQAQYCARSMPTASAGAVAQRCVAIADAAF